MSAIELFPCSGGMAEGFRRAGITFDLAFDKDPNACNSYEKNLGHRPIQMDVRDLVRLVRTGGGLGTPIDLLVADPPCTPWSRAGKRLGTEDERDMLKETAELILLLRPPTYLIGNVPGLQDSTSWHVVQEVIGGLAQHGYCVRDYVSLDAADYGVPQHRVRPFWFGHLEGPCVRWPAPTHGDPANGLAFPGLGLHPWVTCRQALGHLPLEQLGRAVRMRLRPVQGKNGSDESRMAHPDAPGTVVTASGHRRGGRVLLGNSKHPVNRPDRPSFAVTTKGDGRGAQGACVMRVQNPNHPPTQPDDPHRTLTRTQDGDCHLLAWPWDRPGTTVTTRDTVPPPGHHPESGSILSLPNAVILSERAAAILQGFPEGWVFAGKTKTSRWSQIGQAMPPGLAAPVARAIAEQMAAARTEAT